MSDRIRELVEVPVDFFKEGTQFLNRCTKPNRKGVLCCLRQSSSRSAVRSELALS